jgi:Tol biopolymer transport system component
VISLRLSQTLLLGLSLCGAIACSPEPIVLIDTVDRPVWSPDGSRIIFQLDSGSICAVNADGTGVVSLVDGVADGGYGWSPDGSTLSYEIWGSNSQSDVGVYVVDADAPNPTRIAEGSIPRAGGLAWSPDGQRIAYLGNFTGSTAAFVAVAVGLDKGAPPVPADELASPVGNTPAWSPDGQWIAFTGFLNRRLHTWVYKLRPDGSDLTLLTELDRFGPISAFPSPVAWSPDGEQIAFEANPPLAAGDQDYEQAYLDFVNGPDRREIFVMSSDGSGLVRLTSGSYPSWSPDGASIVFIKRGASRSVHELRRVDLDGSNEITLAAGVGPWGYSWSPDGSEVAFTRDADLYVVEVNGLTEHLLLADGDKACAGSTTTE